MSPSDAAPVHPLFRSVSRRSATQWNAVFLYAELASLLVRNLALVPVYLHHISLAEYGAWLATAALLTYLSSMELGLTSVLPQQLAAAYGARDLERLTDLMTTGLVVCVGIAVGMSTLGAALSPVLPRTLDLDPEVRGRLVASLLLGAASLGLNLLGQSLGAILRALQRPVLPGLAVIAADVLSIALTLALLQRGLGLYALASGLVARGATLLLVNGAALVAVMGGSRHLPLRWSSAAARTLWSLSFVQFAARITSQLSTVADPYLIGLLLGAESTAAYVLTVRAVDMARLVTIRISEAVMPSLAHLGGEADRARMKTFALLLLDIVLVVGAVLSMGALALDGTFVTLWVGPGKYAGHLVVALFAVWSILSGLQIALYNVIFALGDMRGLWRSSRLDTGLRIPLLLILLRPLGLWAAPAAAIAGTVAANVSFLRSLRAHLEMGWEELRARAWKTLRVPLACATLAILFLAALPAARALGWTGFLLAGGLYVILAGGLVALVHPSLPRALRRGAV